MTPRKKARQARFKTPNELMADSLAELTTASAKIRTATLTETIAELPPNEYAVERYFVVQMYDDGFLRDAWFFIGGERCAIPSDVIKAVLAAARKHDDSTAPESIS